MTRTTQEKNTSFRIMLGTLVQGLKVEDVDYEGVPYGMHNGIKVYVDKAVPGDVADVAMIKSFKDNKSLATGRIISLRHPSPLRIEPFCKHFAYCGGCQWQNISYAEQLRIKQQQVKALFAMLPDEQYELLPIIPAAEQQRYRNRVTFTFSNRRWMSPEELSNINTVKRPAAGYLLKGKNDRVMNIEECYLTDSFALELMKALQDEALERGYSFFDARQEKGLLRSLTVRFGSRNSIMVMVTFGEENREQTAQIMQYLANTFPQITSLYYSVNKSRRGYGEASHFIWYGGVEYIEYEIARLTFRVRPESFFQTNTLQTEVLYGIAKNFAQLTGSETVYDLYTGTGTIALFISGHAKSVTGIDSVPRSIEDAKENARRNGILNASFWVSDLRDGLTRDIISQSGKPDVVIADPPRAGMYRAAVQWLLDSEAGSIVYISCNPLTQVRDIRNLSSHYRVTKVQPVDMFPQTSHIESVVLLERR